MYIRLFTMDKRGLPNAQFIKIRKKVFILYTKNKKGEKRCQALLLFVEATLLQTNNIMNHRFSTLSVMQS